MASIFSKYIIPLSAVSVVFLLAVQLTSAEKECYEDKQEQCFQTYINKLEAHNNQENSFCDAIRNWIDCSAEAFECDEENARRWRFVRWWYFVLFNRTCDWSEEFDVPPEFASGIAFGDPHYAINGKDRVRRVVTCNAPGKMLLAQGRRWSVEVNHKVVGSTEGAVVDKVKVSVYAKADGFVLKPTGTPTKVVEYTLDSLPSEETTQGISIRSDGLTTEWGLEVSAKRRSDHFEVGVSGPDMNNGILLNGCADNGYGDFIFPSERRFSAMDLPSLAKRLWRPLHTQSSNTTVSGKCKNVDSVFQEACAYDAQQMNEDWAADSASSAVSLATEMKKKEVKSQKEAKDNFEKTRAGVAATMVQGSILLMVIMAIMMF